MLLNQENGDRETEKVYGERGQLFFPRLIP